jgi:ATP-dependent RNA helicase DDX51/DBP6
MMVCESSNKPLFLFLLAHHYNATNALVFTKSAESTSRLLNLLAFFEQAWSQDGSEGKQPITAEAFSSDLAASQRKVVLERFKQKQINM